MAARPLAALGFVGFALFWAALFAFSAMRPEYSHLRNAISELGVLRAPNMFAWNVLGFGIPGLALLLFGWHVGRISKPGAILMPALLTSVGASLMLSGVFPADLANRSGLLTQLHIAASMLGLLWIPGAVWLCCSVKRRWPAAFWITASIAALFLLSILSTDSLPRGLGQRLRFAAVLAWYPLMAMLIHQGSTPKHPAGYAARRN